MRKKKIQIVPQICKKRKNKFVTFVSSMCNPNNNRNSDTCYPNHYTKYNHKEAKYSCAYKKQEIRLPQAN